ncbi:hypothetical protein GCM10010470_01760 [Saccharopolyspora taberi]|uniref:Uncharacterized protein n=1 Tax=Saccharopolyspora taberi TaxID=60895 RepID=A0ABN3V123_9PSEU
MHAPVSTHIHDTDDTSFIDPQSKHRTVFGQQVHTWIPDTPPRTAPGQWS